MHDNWNFSKRTYDRILYILRYFYLTIGIWWEIVVDKSSTPKLVHLMKAIWINKTYTRNRERHRPENSIRMDLMCVLDETCAVKMLSIVKAAPKSRRTMCPGSVCLSWYVNMSNASFVSQFIDYGKCTVSKSIFDIRTAHKFKCFSCKPNECVRMRCRFYSSVTERDR